jgi:hypothetical protein
VSFTLVSLYPPHHEFMIHFRHFDYIGKRV